MQIIKRFFFIILLSLPFLKVEADKIKHNPSNIITIAGDYWCPYNCMPDSKDPGFLVELASKALKIYDIDVKYVMMPWHEAIASVRSGKIDGVIGVTHLKGRNLVTTKTPIDYSTISSFTRNDTDWLYDEPESLRGKKLGIIAEYMKDELVNNYIGANYIDNTGMFVMEDDEMASPKMIKHLLGGQIDVYMEDKRVVANYLNANNIKDKIRDAGSLNQAELPIYIALSDKMPLARRYLSFLEKGIEALKMSGDYDILRKKYKMDEQ